MENECLIDVEKLASKNETLTDELIEFLKLKFPEFEVEKEGNNVIVKSEGKVSKRKIRLYLKKFLHKNELSEEFKAVSGGGNTLTILKLATTKEEME